MQASMGDRSNTRRKAFEMRWLAVNAEQVKHRGSKIRHRGYDRYSWGWLSSVMTYRGRQELTCGVEAGRDPCARRQLHTENER